MGTTPRPASEVGPEKPKKKLGDLSRGHLAGPEPFFLSLSGEIFHPLHPTPQFPNP